MRLIPAFAGRTMGLEAKSGLLPVPGFSDGTFAGFTLPILMYSGKRYLEVFGWLRVNVDSQKDIILKRSHLLQICI